MGGWRFLCGVLTMVQVNAIAFAQAPEVANVEPQQSLANEADPEVSADASTEPGDANFAVDRPEGDEEPTGVDGEAPLEVPEAEAAAAEEAPSATPSAPSPPSPPSAASPSPLAPHVTAEIEFMVRSAQPGQLRFESADGQRQEYRIPGRVALGASTYQVTWVPSGGTRELLRDAWQPNGEALRVAHRGPSFTNRLGYWLFGNGLLVGIPVSLGVFAKRDDLGAAAAFSIIGVNTLVAIAGAILMGVGDDEVIELEAN